MVKGTIINFKLVVSKKKSRSAQNLSRRHFFAGNEHHFVVFYSGNGKYKCNTAVVFYEEKKRSTGIKSLGIDIPFF
jgi:hypothetical protein